MKKETDSQLTAGQGLPAPVCSPVASHQGTSILSDENGPRAQGQPFKAAEVTAEEWWARHAALLAEKMKIGGVQDFRVSRTDRGTYEFEVNPIQENI